MAWGLFVENAWRVRVVAGVGGAFVTGVETASVIAALVRNGIPIDVAEHLIAACEQGFITARNERDDDGDEQA